jgi:Uma2 family endonuclease
MRSGRVRRIEKVENGDYIEIEGTPDMVLEVVSDYSVQKDTMDLPKLYYNAGVTEYWLVDARKSPVRFDLFKRGAKKYTATRRQSGGWLRSEVLGRSFRLTTQTDPLGDPQYTLAARD